MSGFTVKSNFFCQFKTGDNVNYNLKIIAQLYYYYDISDVPSKKLLIKPIVCLLVSISEAILHDFHKRIKANTSEGVINISNAVLNHIRCGKIDELEKYIASAKKHDFFDLKNTNFYAILEMLRKVRNRVHIQNAKLYKPLGDEEVFTEEVKILSEKCTEMVAKTMSRKYARPERVDGFVEDMKFPWDSYFIENEGRFTNVIK